MAITAQMVKDLRETTGAGMMDCKKALTETDGDMEKAVVWLREKGLASASARSGKIASEGLVFASLNDDKSVALVIEVNSETDFVAKNENFRDFVEDCAKHAYDTAAKDADEFLKDAWKLDGADTVGDALTQKVSVIGENLKIRRFEKVKMENPGALSTYIHGNGKIAVIVQLECAKVCEELREAGKNVAMQVAAMSPRFTSREEMDQDFIKSEREILVNQAKQDPKNASKPEAVIEKIVEGKLQKSFKEVCLVDQEYIKGEGESISGYLETVSKQIGSPIKVVKYVRYAVGEGIEKKEENFADEVAKAMGNQ